MIFKYRYRVGPAHTRVRVFAGRTDGALGKCGDLTMRNEEWEAFRIASFRTEVFVDDTTAESETSLPLDLP